MVARWLLVVAAAALACVVGPRISTPHGHDAKAPFVYVPPPGVDPAPSSRGAEIWVTRDAFAGPASQSTRIALSHTDKTMAVDDEALARLLPDMPQAFPDCTWVHRSHETRTRPDGTRVGAISADCDRTLEIVGLPPVVRHTRKLQLVFPDDQGTSIVTASYPTDEAPRWEPLLDDSALAATGVALRLPPPSAFAYAAWAVAGVVIGYLLAMIIRKKS